MTAVTVMKEDINPMEGTGNLADAMLVLALGYDDSSNNELER